MNNKINTDEAKRQFAELSPEERQDYVRNKLAVPIVRMIMEPVIANRGGAPDIMMMLESVCVGVMLTLAKQRAGDARGMWEVMVKNVRSRIAEHE
jgi:hypothetical protein